MLISNSNRVWLNLLTNIISGLLLSLPTMTAAFFSEDNSSLSGNLAFDYSTSARTKALGGATVASPLDAGSAYDNPAGLARLRSFTASLLYSNLFENTYVNSFSYIHPFKLRGAFEFSWLGLTSSNFDARDDQNNTLGNFNDAQHLFIAAYGEKFAPDWLIGASIKSLVHQIYRYSEARLSLDAGAEYLIFPNLTAGAKLSNLFTLHLFGGSQDETFPFNVVLGGSWRPFAKTPNLESIALMGEFDLTDIWGNHGGVVKHLNEGRLGLEYKPYSFLALRGGVRDNNLSTGLGLTWLNLQMDYALDLHPLGILHWISLSMRLGDHVDRERINQLYQNAMTAYQTKHWNESIENWRAILVLEPGNTAAKKYLEQTQEDREKDLTVRVAAAAAEYQQGNLENALKEYELASEAAPEDAELARKKSEVFQKVEAHRKAEQEKKISEHLQAAEKYYQSKELSKALQEWEAVLALDKDYPQAAATIQRLRAEISAKIDEHFSEGIALFNRGDHAEAIQQFQDILVADPNYHLAKLYLEKSQQALSNDLKAQYRKAIRNFRNGKYSEAAELFEAIAKKQANFLETQTYLQLSRQRQEALSAAQQGYKKAAEFFSQSKARQAVEIMQPLMQKGVFTPEMAAFYQKIKRAKELASRYYSEGIEAYRNGKLEESIQRFNQSIYLDAGSPSRALLFEVYTTMGIRAYRREQLPAALTAWENASALEPDNPMIQKYLRRAKNKIQFFKEKFGENYFK